MSYGFTAPEKTKDNIIEKEKVEKEIPNEKTSDSEKNINLKRKAEPECPSKMFLFYKSKISFNIECVISFFIFCYVFCKS